MQNRFEEFDVSMRAFWREDGGQDLIEYTLLIFFVLMITTGVFSIGGGSIKGIVSTSNSQITVASQFAAS